MRIASIFIATVFVVSAAVAQPEQRCLPTAYGTVARATEERSLTTDIEVTPEMMAQESGVDVCLSASGPARVGQQFLLKASFRLRDTSGGIPVVYLRNATPSTIQIIAGNVLPIVLTPDVVRNGLYTTQFVIRCLAPGAFIIRSSVAYGLFGLTASTTCDECKKQCPAKDEKCTPPSETVTIVDPRRATFTTASGEVWVPMAKVQIPCYQNTCRTILLEACCTYTRRGSEAEYVDDWWEVTKTDASGQKTTSKPDPVAPCHCGQLYDLLTATSVVTHLKNTGFAERQKTLDEMMKKFCPGLSFDDMVKMARTCGFPNAAKNVISPNINDVYKWIEDVVEGLHGALEHGGH